MQRNPYAICHDINFAKMVMIGKKWHSMDLLTASRTQIHLCAQFNIREKVQACFSSSSFVSSRFFLFASAQSFLSLKQKNRKRHPSRGVSSSGWLIRRGLGHALVSGTKMPERERERESGSTSNQVHTKHVIPAIIGWRRGTRLHSRDSKLPATLCCC